MILQLSDALSREELFKLKSTNNFIVLTDLLIRLSLNVALIYLMFSISASNYVLLFLVWYLYATQFQFWGNAGLGHEALHKRVFSSERMNTFLYDFCSALTWSNSAMFAKAHWLHHRETFSDQDQEAKSEQNWRAIDILGYSFVDFKLMYRRLLYALVNSLGYYPNLTKLDDAYRKSAQKTLVFNCVLYCSIYVFSGNFLVTTLLFLAPFSATLLNKVLAKAQHHLLADFSQSGPLKFSRTLLLPRPLSFLYANMNYHAEHHLAPIVPYYQLPDLHAMLRNRGLIKSVSLVEFIVLWYGSKPALGGLHK